MKIKSNGSIWFVLFFCFPVISSYAQSSPEAPANFEATAGTSAIYLTWRDQADNETRFVILKEWDDEFSHNVEITVPANDTSYVDSDVAPNITYYYTLWAENDFGASDSEDAAAMIHRETPPAPANVTASTGPMTSIRIQFTDNSDLESWYEIQHSEDPNALDFYGKETVTGGMPDSTITYYISDGPFNLVSIPAPDEVFYAPNTTVYIKIRAVINDNGTYIYGPFSPVVSAVTNPLPPKPTNFTAEIVGSGVHVTWNDNSVNEANFLLARYIDEFNPNIDHVVTLPANTTGYTDLDVDPNTTYTYRLMAIDLIEASTPHPELIPYLLTDATRTVETTAHVVIHPPAPADVNVVATSPNSALLTFSDSTDIESWYEIRVSGTPSDSATIYTYEASGSGIGSIVTVDIYDLISDSLYYFLVRGVTETSDGIVYGPYSAAVSLRTPSDSTNTLPAPVAKLATFVTPAAFTANWTAVAGADYYELDVFNIKDSVYLPGFERKLVYDTSYDVTGTRASRRYTYVVRAINASDTSSNSNTVLVTHIKNLTLRTVCADNPATHRHWKVINNNDVPVQVTWAVNNTSQSGTHVALPGESFFFTETVGGTNRTTITWYDDNLIQYNSSKTSTWKPCVNDSTARSYVYAEPEEAHELFNLTAYPNTVSDKLHIRIISDSNEEAQVEIINLQGLSLYSNTLPVNTEVEIDVSRYAQGLFLVKARQQRYHQTIKIIRK